MRTALYMLGFVFVGISAVLRTIHFAVLYSAKVSLLSIHPQIGMLIQTFGQPFPVLFAGDAFHFVSIAASAALALLVFRRLVIMARTRTLAPASFRGFSYYESYVALALIVVALATFAAGLGFTLPLLALTPAHLCLVLAFIVSEVASFKSQATIVHPNTTVDTDARKSGARGSP